MEKDKLIEKAIEATVTGKKEEAIKLAKEVVDKQYDILEVIDKGYTVGLQKTGDLWEQGEYFLPELISSAECMKEAMKIFQPELERSKMSVKSLGKVVIGTIEGDIHDIGKNLVSSLLSANGFNVIDLGTDVKLDEFIKKAEEHETDFICLSSLLTTTMLAQKKFIDMLKDKQLWGRYKVIVGGAPVTQKWAQDIGADGYAENAITAVKTIKEMLEEKRSK